MKLVVFTLFIGLFLMATLSFDCQMRNREAVVVCQNDSQTGIVLNDMGLLSLYISGSSSPLNVWIPFYATVPPYAQVEIIRYQVTAPYEICRFNVRKRGL